MGEQTTGTSEGEKTGTDLLDPYEKLVPIEVLGNEVMVPEKNRLLRCFQYLSINTISYGDFCWNGECLNCQVWIDSGGKEKAVIACRTNAVEGMKIVRISADIPFEMDQSR